MSVKQGRFVWDEVETKAGKKEAHSRQIIDVAALKKLAARNFDARPKDAK